MDQRLTSRASGRPTIERTVPAVEGIGDLFAVAGPRRGTVQRAAGSELTAGVAGKIQDPDILLARRPIELDDGELCPVGRKCRLLVDIGVAHCLDDVSATVENRQLAGKQPAANRVTRRDRAALSRDLDRRVQRKGHR
jgi:hypothetical protein